MRLLVSPSLLTLSPTVHATRYYHGLKLEDGTPVRISDNEVYRYFPLRILNEVKKYTRGPQLHDTVLADFNERLIKDQATYLYLWLDGDEFSEVKYDLKNLLQGTQVVDLHLYLGKSQSLEVKRDLPKLLQGTQVVDLHLFGTGSSQVKKFRAGCISQEIASDEEKEPINPGKSFANEVEDSRKLKEDDVRQKKCLIM